MMHKIMFLSSFWSNDHCLPLLFDGLVEILCAQQLKANVNLFSDLFIRFFFHLITMSQEINDATPEVAEAAEEV